MPSKTTILNAALRHLGQPPLVIDPDAPQEYAAAGDVIAAWDDWLGTVLAACEWDCAKARVALDADLTAPAFGFAYSYTLPGDCVRVWKLDESHGSDVDYELEAGKLLTDTPAQLKLHYIRRLTTGDEFDEALSTAFAFRIASACALKIVGSQTLADEMEKAYDRAISDARRIDATQGNSERKRQPETSWTVNRVTA